MVTVRVVDRLGEGFAEFPGGDGAPLLDQMEQHCPFEVPSLCSVGACGRCAAGVVSGGELVDPDAFGIGASEQAGEGRFLVCVAGLRPDAVRSSATRVLVLEIA